MRFNAVVSQYGLPQCPQVSHCLEGEYYSRIRPSKHRQGKQNLYRKKLSIRDRCQHQGQRVLITLFCEPGQSFKSR